MKAVARQAAAGLAFIAMGVAVSLGVAVVHGVQASPDPGVSYVWRGMLPWDGQYCEPFKDDPEYGQYWIPGHHPCWHDDEDGYYSAIDYNWGSGPDDDVGNSVWLDYSGDFQRFKMRRYTDHCTGIRAEIYQGSYSKGDLHYLHIDPNEFWIDKDVPYQTIYIGDVLAQDNPGCMTAPHLHQSADVSAATPFYTNKLEDPTQGDNWEHAIMWQAGGADSDGDGWTNAKELYIGTDPFDRCPPPDDAWPPDIDNDSCATVLDVLRFIPHLFCSVGDDCYDNRFDLDTDGSVNVLDILVLPPFLLKRCTMDWCR